jgi:hypothetical protein
VSKHQAQPLLEERRKEEAPLFSCHEGTVCLTTRDGVSRVEPASSTGAKVFKLCPPQLRVTAHPSLREDIERPSEASGCSTASGSGCQTCPLRDPHYCFHATLALRADTQLVHVVHSEQNDRNHRSKDKVWCQNLSVDLSVETRNR